MTFEEFLIKKKINPVQLKDTEQAFFDEFKSHFDQMGEISFDHSKKFWFNKLRRAYPLAEEVKIPVVEVRDSVAEALLPQAEALESPVAEALEATSFENHKAPQAEALETPVAEVLEAKPTFKPRFKANIPAKTEVKDEKTTVTPNSEPTIPTDTAKPAYKPRFKAPAKPADELEVKESDIAPQQEIVDPKPAYRPRFKGGVGNKDEG